MVTSEMISNLGSVDCPRCGAVIQGNFCPQCGHKVKKSRITPKTLLAAMFETITNWEQKMVLTVKTLLLAPGTVPMAFISGERRRFFHPVKFLMFWAGIHLLLSNLVGFQAAGASRAEFESNYGNLIWVISIPGFALGTYICFIKKPYNFVEHVVVHCYITGFNLILGLIPLSIALFWHPILEIMVYIPVIFIFYIYMVKSFFLKEKTLRNIILSMLTGVISVICGFMMVALIYAIHDFLKPYIIK